jgi:putative peptidoglycan lipid II flippase
LASLAMGAALWVILQRHDLLAELVPFGRFVETLVFVLAGAVVYGLAALVFGAIRFSDLRNMARRTSG